jgi:hypothetical protein
MNNIDRYNQLNRKPKTSTKIITHVPKPTESDYQRGFIRRYFIQKLNDTLSPVYEVDYERFGNYKSDPYFSSVTLKWRISGPKETKYDNNGNVVDKAASESNRISIQISSDKIPNLKLYLPNLLQFHK